MMWVDNPNGAPGFQTGDAILVAIAFGQHTLSSFEVPFGNTPFFSLAR